MTHDKCPKIIITPWCRLLAHRQGLASPVPWQQAGGDGRRDGPAEPRRAPVGAAGQPSGPQYSSVAPYVPGAHAVHPSGDGLSLFPAQRPEAAGGAAGRRGARGLPGGRPEGPGRGGGAGGQPGQCEGGLRSEAGE